MPGRASLAPVNLNLRLQPPNFSEKRLGIRKPILRKQAAHPVRDVPCPLSTAQQHANGDLSCDGRGLVLSYGLMFLPENPRRLELPGF